MKNLLFTIIQRLIINAMYMFIHSEDDSEHTIMRIKTSAPKHQLSISLTACTHKFICLRVRHKMLIRCAVENLNNS